MGLFDFFKKGWRKKDVRYAPTMDGSAPFYAGFGNSIYASDIVVQSIRCKANEFKKLKPQHIRTKDGVKSTITNSSIARVLKRPNEYMTTAEFLEKITILYELNKNVFIYPTSYISNGGERIYTGLYPLKPTYVEYLTDENGVYYVHMQFGNGYENTLPASSLIHWRKDYGVNDYFGGGVSGSNDDIGLLNMLRRYDELTQSIAKALKVSCQINGIVNYNSYRDDETLEAKRIEFEQRIQNNESGILFSDQKYEYTPLPRDVKLVDTDTLKFFYETILRANGTPLCILNGDYTKAQKEAYYEHALEADIIALGQAMSKTMFSENETAHGNEIILYPNNIVFMSMENKIAFANIAMPSGSLMKDEFRELFGYAPLPDGQGQVISQGYNNLLDEDNKNKLGGESNE